MPLSASNPFAPFLIVQHGVSGTPDDDPRYQKGVLDFLLIAYYIVFWSLCRILIAGRAFPRLGRYCGLKNAAKLERVGEQGYAMCYFIVTGIWGLKIMVQLPIWWYRTDEFWRGYPHWDMIPELKQYYLMQAAHWLHELIIMVLGLERPRKDYKELVVHHIVTLWLIGWSYLTNLTYIGVSVFVSMDVPDVILSLTLLLNYLQMNRIKIPVFFVFFGVWTYFRHWLNLVILHSVWTEFDLIPDIYRRWAPSTGVWLAWWMKYQIFVPIALLQLLNVFWYYLMLRVLYRCVIGVCNLSKRSDADSLIGLSRRRKPTTCERMTMVREPGRRRRRDDYICIRQLTRKELLWYTATSRV
ncbi:TLC domain-containing protein [Schizophyllum amplum]|uniref:TLC domain-containing protein n=1 Tax=Schizophyllum amplum TaxID=97359 RepID=A0A550CSI1_9AGAR|nr:TLC domain-containing protein [Auriculariopsis ampla]